jgi:hypothetical protein
VKRARQRVPGGSRAAWLPRSGRSGRSNYGPPLTNAEHRLTFGSSWCQLARPTFNLKATQGTALLGTSSQWPTTMASHGITATFFAWLRPRPTLASPSYRVGLSPPNAGWWHTARHHDIAWESRQTGTPSARDASNRATAAQRVRLHRRRPRRLRCHVEWT